MAAIPNPIAINENVIHVHSILPNSFFSKKKSPGPTQRMNRPISTATIVKLINRTLENFSNGKINCPTMSLCED